MILIAMVIYFLVGIEIAKRRGALQSISSDPVLLDDIIVSPTNSSYNKSYNDVETGSQSGPFFTLHSGEGSPPASRRPTTSPHHPTATATHRSPLSFRQFILMPLLFFIVLLSVWVAPSTNRIASFINPHFSSYPLLLAVGATGSLRGFWNGVIFITIGWKSRKGRNVPL